MYKYVCFYWQPLRYVYFHRDKVGVTIYCKNAYPGNVKHSDFVSTVEQIAKRQDWDSQTEHIKRHLHQNEYQREQWTTLQGKVQFFFDVTIVKFGNYAKGDHYKVTCKITSSEWKQIMFQISIDITKVYLILLLSENFYFQQLYQIIL